MNILFLTLSSNVDLDDSQSIYGSLLSRLIEKGNEVFVVSPSERRNNKKTFLIEKQHYKLLKVKTGNIQKTNIIEKGISTILIESQFKKAIIKYFGNVKFDLIIYATPPITFYNVIKYFKKRDKSKTYLMLKDIFPQNAVDLGMFSKKSFIYKYFRSKEIKLYKISDTIGCMSPKNKEYLLEHNPFLNVNKVEVLPNSINPSDNNIRNYALNKKYRKKYNIDLKAKVFMYGGNLGKPQGIPFIIECLKKIKNLENIFVIICGSGTEYKKIYDFINDTKINNVFLLNGLPKKEYTELLNIADVGLIFLDYRFTIPNFPSRLLSYLEKGIPVIACTDPNTDIGNIIQLNNFGWKCYSNNSEEFKKMVCDISKYDNNKLKGYGTNGLEYLRNHYSSEKSANIILKGVLK